jgi:hypothetical protein
MDNRLAGGLSSHHNNAPTLRKLRLWISQVFSGTGANMRDGALGNVNFSANARM